MTRTNRNIFTIVVGVTILVLWLGSAKPARAISVDIWDPIGPPEYWTITESKITGWSPFSFEKYYLVTKPDKIPELVDFRFQFRLHPVQGVDHNFVWNFQDTGNYYQAHFSETGMEVSRFRNGQQVLSSQVPWLILQGPQTYAISLTQQDDLLTLRVDSQIVWNFQDPTHDEKSRGAVGFKMAAGTVVPVESQWTEIRIDDYAVKMIPVQLLKQNDGPWAGLEYDSASEWSSNPTISRWGCALTSLVMILHYHQLVSFPDGRTVTPATLNEWLISQPDGYVGEGLVNWFAAMRLVREMSEWYASTGKVRPKLEFSYQGPANWQAVAEEEIRLNRPPIVNVPGHFAALYGFDVREGEFYIRDPFYSYTKTSDHSAVLSLRLFRPSQTDLSEIVVVHKPGAVVEILDEAGASVAETWLEYIEAEGESSEPWQFTVVFKPENGVYDVQVNGEVAEGAEGAEGVTLFAYDEEANMVSFPLTGDASLVYSKTGESELVPLEEPPEEPSEELPEEELPEEPVEEPPTEDFSWQEFMDAVMAEYEQENLTERQAYRLVSVATWALQSEEDTWPRYTAYAVRLLDFYADDIELEARERLLALLQ